MQQNLKNSNFPTKLSQILSKQKYNDVLRWDQTRSIIELVDQYKLQTIILPKYFRHNRIQSFFRQLNLYGFQKTKANGVDYFSNPLIKQGKKLKDLKSRNQIMRQKYNNDSQYRQSVNREVEPKPAEVQKNDNYQQTPPSLYNVVSSQQTPIQKQIYPFMDQSYVLSPFYNTFMYTYPTDNFSYFGNMN